MTTSAKKYLTFLVVVLIAAAVFFGARYGMDKYKDHLLQKSLDTHAARMVDLSKVSDIENFHARVDAVRDFVHDNSQHNMGEEFYAAWPDKTAVAKVFVEGLEGKRKDLPHMECSTRSNTMAQMLNVMDLDTRNIVLYSTKNNLANHRIIEVRNPENGNWEAHDVSYNIYWRNKETKQRVSLAEVGAAPDAHEPCNPERCGWNAKTIDHHAADEEMHNPQELRHLLGIIAIHDEESGLRIALYADGVQPEHRYTMSDEQGTFCHFFGKNCADGFIPMKDFNS
ncbi:MAG: hypothetical protein DI626_06540 [Micavibrio aeruginosavorus]|uniref:Transglutaminase-like domain-containing protein n=1 Tax=Micavibrio aeruginosavorus TaxID=349221 RepID=A0A2W4ZVZ4_9BACT|nr:MAG: hypothetical protein DI626_06540 [Micavibrio aeruginosavorus]